MEKTRRTATLSRTRRSSQRRLFALLPVGQAVRGGKVRLPMQLPLQTQALPPRVSRRMDGALFQRKVERTVEEGGIKGLEPLHHELLHIISKLTLMVRYEPRAFLCPMIRILSHGPLTGVTDLGLKLYD